MTNTLSTGQPFTGISETETVVQALVLHVQTFDQEFSFSIVVADLDTVQLFLTQQMAVEAEPLQRMRLYSHVNMLKGLRMFLHNIHQL